jgi:hypothetical protein
MHQIPITSVSESQEVKSILVYLQDSMSSTENDSQLENGTTFPNLHLVGFDINSEWMLY